MIVFKLIYIFSYKQTSKEDIQSFKFQDLTGQKEEEAGTSQELVNIISKSHISNWQGCYTKKPHKLELLFLEF